MDRVKMEKTFFVLSRGSIVVFCILGWASMLELLPDQKAFPVGLLFAAIGVVFELFRRRCAN